MTLKSQAFKNDPRVKQAKKLLHEALMENKKSISAVSPPDPSKAIRYQELIQAMASSRGAPLFYPYIGSGIGNGSLVELMDGSIKYDMITGIGVHYFGHSDPELMESAFEASLANTIMQGNLQQNEDSLELMEILIKESDLPHCFLTTSGVMANENAIKIAFQKNAPASRILAFNGCFAGRSLSLSQITDKPSFREGLPLNLPVDYIPYYDSLNPKESIDIARNELKKIIRRYPGQHAIMIFELIQGEGGFYPGTADFFRPLMEICKDKNIAVFSDEVQTFGRTSQLFTFKHFGLEKYVDIVAVGKLTQACATLFNHHYCPKVGLLSQTFTSSTSAIKASIMILRRLLKGNFFGKEGRIMEIEKRFHAFLSRLQKQHPGIIRGPFGLGAMVAFTPFDGSHKTAVDLAKRIFDAGVITFIAGQDPVRIRLLPPAGVISNDDIDESMEIIKKTLLEVKNV